MPMQLVRRDGRNHHREVGFVCVFSVYRTLSRTTCEGCTSGSLADRPHQGVLIVSDRAEHEDEIRFADPRLLQSLPGGLTTRDVGIVMATHADPGFGSHRRTSSCLLRTHLGLGRGSDPGLTNQASACCGDAITPNCCIRPIMSNWPLNSTIFPPTMR